MSSPLHDKTRTPRMFSTISHRYDLLNHVLSLNIDRLWRARLVAASRITSGDVVVDAATGTADVALAFASKTSVGEIVGIDRSPGMLAVGREKVHRRHLSDRIDLVEGDVLDLPVGDATTDVVTIAFGLRNLPDYGAGLREMARVLKSGGRLLVLEFFPPRGGLLLRGYKFYLGRILPVAGRVISGSPEAYDYLANSIAGFISHEELDAQMKAAGLVSIEVQRLTGGIAYIYRGVKA